MCNSARSKRYRNLLGQLYIAFAVVIITTLSACNSTTSPHAIAHPTKIKSQTEEPTLLSQESFAGTQPAPEFPALDWLNTARPLSMAELRGKVVLLDFWTYGCINCMHVIPDLKRLEEKYADELVVIGVHSAKFDNEGDTDNLRQIILRYELAHPVINDKDFTVWRMYGARAWPTFVIIDPAGNIAGKHSGEGIYETFDHIIGSLVSEFAARGQIDRRSLDLKLEREGLPETILSFPGKVLADAAGNRLFIADTNHNRVIVADLKSYEIECVIGGEERGLVDGDFRTARFHHPQGMALGANGRVLYVADTENHAIRAVDLMSETVETIAGTGQQSHLYPGRAGQATEVALNSPWDLELIGDQLYIAMAGSHQLWRIDLSSGIIAPWAGSGREGIDDGRLEWATLAQPSGLTTDGKWIYFADSEASAIRAAGLEASGMSGVKTLVGTGLFDFGDEDGVGNKARLQHALGIAYYSEDELLYVADTYNSKIKTIDPRTREARTLLGEEHGWRDGESPLFYEPGGVDIAGDRLYVADTNNHAIRVIDLNTRDTSTVVLRDPEGRLSLMEECESKCITLEAQTVGAGAGTIRLNVILPRGYKVNDMAPFSLSWQPNDLVSFAEGETQYRVVEPNFPLEIPASFAVGQQTVDADLTVYYCQIGKESLCLIDRARLQVPLQVQEVGGAVLRLKYVLAAP